MAAAPHLANSQQDATASPVPQLVELAADAAEAATTDLVLVRCQGVKESTYKQCRRKWRAPSAAAKDAYCILHQSQAPGSTAAPLRRCDGFTVEGFKCSRPIPSAPTDKPAFCKTHSDQSHLVNYIRCFGKSTDGSPCPNPVRWATPYFQFCPDHASQAACLGCPVTSLPNDVAAMIIAALTPVDRVAFALANRSCAALVRACTLSVPVPEHLKSESLTIWTYTDKNCFTLATPCEECGAAGFLSPSSREFLRRPGFGYRSGAVQHHFTRFEEPIILTPCKTCKCCYCPEQPVRTFPFEELYQSNEGFWPREDYFIHSVMRKYPYLFSSALGRCMRCHTQLSAEDSRSWTARVQKKTATSTNLPPLWRRRMDAWRATNPLDPFATGANIRTNIKDTDSAAYVSPFLTRKRGACKAYKNLETLLCADCNDVSIAFDWCSKCHGEVNPLAVARAYWRTQIPRDDELETNGTGGARKKVRTN